MTIAQLGISIFYFVMANRILKQLKQFDSKNVNSYVKRLTRKIVGSGIGMVLFICIAPVTATPLFFGNAWVYASTIAAIQVRFMLLVIVAMIIFVIVVLSSKF